MKILIAEDDPFANKLLLVSLQKWGHKVKAVSDGLAAVNAYENDPLYDIAILDWMMPGMEGPDVCQRIKHGTAKGFTYVILLAGKTNKNDIVEALEAGADDYITKPWDAPELKARIRAGERIVKLERDLVKQLIEVKQLQGIIPICAWCKKVRDDADYWSSVEEYISKRTEAEFSHSICPLCMEEKYPEIDTINKTEPSPHTCKGLSSGN